MSGTLKLFGSTKKFMEKTKNGETVSNLEISWSTFSPM